MVSGCSGLSSGFALPDHSWPAHGCQERNPALMYVKKNALPHAVASRLIILCFNFLSILVYNTVGEHTPYGKIKN